MNRKKIWLSSLAVALLGLSVVRGQSPDMNGSPPAMTAMPSGMPMPLGVPTAPADPAMAAPMGQHYTLSRWILGERCAGCCGPIGCDGPIGGEVYLRTGGSFPINGGALSQAIEPGWDIEGGCRSLFFNRDDDAAWSVDVSITNIFNPANKNAGQVLLQNIPMNTISATTGAATVVNVPTLNVTPGNLNRTSVNLAGGREMWLMGTADSSCNDLNWRVGWDVGGRWGTQKLEFNEIQHRNSSFGGVFVGLHSDVEVPFGSAVLFTGIRLEWGSDFSQILQNDNSGNVMDINLTGEIGIRF